MWGRSTFESGATSRVHRPHRPPRQTPSTIELHCLSTLSRHRPTQFVNRGCSKARLLLLLCCCGRSITHVGVVVACVVSAKAASPRVHTAAWRSGSGCHGIRHVHGPPPRSHPRSKPGRTMGWLASGAAVDPNPRRSLGRLNNQLTQRFQQHPHKLHTDTPPRVSTSFLAAMPAAAVRARAAALVVLAQARRAAPRQQQSQAAARQLSSAAVRTRRLLPPTSAAAAAPAPPALAPWSSRRRGLSTQQAEDAPCCGVPGCQHRQPHTHGKDGETTDSGCDACT